MMGVFKGLISWCVVLLQKNVFWNVTLADAWRRCIQWQLGGKQLGTHARGSNGLCPVTPYMALTCFHRGVLQPDAVFRPTTNQAATTAPPEMPAPKASESKVCQVWHLSFKTPNVEERETGHLPCVSGGDWEIPQIDEKLTANSKI